MYPDTLKRGLWEIWNRYTYIIPPIIASILYFNITFGRLMPFWSDPGEWLKYAKAYEALFFSLLGYRNSEIESWFNVMWGQNIFGYPPLALIGVSIFRRIFGDVPGIEYFGSLLYVIQPIPIYFITYKISESRLSSILASMYIIFLPGLMEIFGWGGYPNLLGFILLAISLYLILEFINLLNMRFFLLTLVFSSLVVFTHHLTTAVYISILVVWTILLLLTKEYKYANYLIFISLYTISIFLVYRLVLGYLEDYIFFNEAAYYELRIDYAKMIYWIFKNPLTYTLGGILSAIGLWNIRKNRVYLTLILSWISTCILLTFGYLVGISLDYNRFLIFLVQPIPILMGIAFKNLRRPYILELIIHYRRHIYTIFLTILMVLSLFSFFIVSSNAEDELIKWYERRDRYGWWGRLDALTWIRNNTPLDSIFVADELMGRWIEGYASRKAFIDTEPKWLFRYGQLKEYYISSMIRNGYVEYYSSRYRISIQTPYNPRYSIIVNYWKKGYYIRAFHIPIPDIVYLKDLFDSGDTINITDSGLAVLNTTGFKAIYYLNDSNKVVQDFRVYNEYSVLIRFRFSYIPKKYIGIPIKLNNDTFRGFIIDNGEIVIRLLDGRIRISISSYKDVYLLPWEKDKLLIVSDMAEIYMKISFETSGYNRDVYGINFVRADDYIRDYGIDYIVISARDFRDMKSPQYFLRKLYPVAYYNDYVTVLKTGPSI